MSRAIEAGAAFLITVMATGGMALGQDCDGGWEGSGGGAVSALHGWTDGSGNPIVVAGGNFTQAGGIAADRVARWDGSAWIPMGNGLNNAVRSFTVHDGSLYAAGLFDGPSPASRLIARWDGANWVSVAGGIEGSILNGVASFGGQLYVGGSFVLNLGTSNPIANIARTTGGVWDDLPSQLNPFFQGVNGPVSALLAVDETSAVGPGLYVGGNFIQAGGGEPNGGVSASRIAMWNGWAWYSVGAGFNLPVTALAYFNGEVYAAGAFTGEPGYPTTGMGFSHIARWNGTSWSPVGLGLDGDVLAMAVHDDGTGEALYVGGNFTMAGNTWVNRVAKWDGSTWSAVDNGTNGPVSALLGIESSSEVGPGLYAGGSFTFAGMTPASCVAMYDPPSWQAVGPTVSLEDCNENGEPDACDIFDGVSEDCDFNGIPDECELAGNDCDGNGVPDSCDPDCDGDGIPDECELGDDCNANGVPDSCDLNNGTSFDCNFNGIPDECDAGTTDCNVNGIPDSCELEGNDCNENGILDDCESLPDCNGNGVPDECEELADCNNNDVPDACEDLADCNNNGTPDECETFEDCNDNGVPDECEEDCNGNGVPDDCDVPFDDCNDNGVPDSCDLDAGTSNDCNSNGIPDECEEDCNGNGVPEDCESFTDCNANDVPDECDVAGGSSLDANGNGIPDECEDDCNDNGVPDDQDILSGTSTDLNENGVPDDCEPDCNGNGVPDDVDIADGTSGDCNANDVPDSCDIANGTEPDENGNGIPDDCEGVDCNGNGVPDADDITSGTSEDCNVNGVPDECEMVDGDCNGNGELDDCEPQTVFIGVQNGTFSAFDGNWSNHNGGGSISYNGSDVQVTGRDDGFPGFTWFDQANVEMMFVQLEFDLLSYTSADAGSFDYPVFYLDGTFYGLNLDGTLGPSTVGDAGGAGTVNNDNQVSTPIHFVVDLPILAQGLHEIGLGVISVDGSNGAGVAVFDNVRPARTEVGLDCDDSGELDLCEILDGLLDDCNTNGIPDACDISLGLATDLNGNDVPDNCEEDCNGNGVPDDVDIAQGTSQDGNGDGVPDECAPDIPGDVDGDGDVDVDDLVQVILNWGACPGSPCVGDVNEDGTVDVDDLVAVILNWG
ncbi:MAG: hypothetical protein ACYTJ0_05370 [Planctomycetota bacterium]